MIRGRAIRARSRGERVGRADNASVYDAPRSGGTSDLRGVVAGGFTGLSLLWSFPVLSAQVRLKKLESPPSYVAPRVLQRDSEFWSYQPVVGFGQRDETRLAPNLYQRIVKKLRVLKRNNLILIA